MLPRADALRALAEDSFDVLVIGGGITGAGVALDAASRGLRTALVERHDFASGTSSTSSNTRASPVISGCHCGGSANRRRSASGSNRAASTAGRWASSPTVGTASGSKMGTLVVMRQA